MDWFSAGLVFCAGFATAVVVGARNGRELAEEARGIVETCQDVARWDAAACEQRAAERFDLVADALAVLGDRCVLSVPAGDRLRVVRVPPVVLPSIPDDPEG